MMCQNVETSFRLIWPSGTLKLAVATSFETLEGLIGDDLMSATSPNSTIKANALIFESF